MRLPATLVALLLLPPLTGCATLRATANGWTQGRSGLSRPQRQLRNALADGDFATALTTRDDDPLLQSLTAGISTYYAAQFERSVALLDTATLIADARVTSSISRHGLALLTNDMARPYEARPTERLFVPFYAMLACTRLGRWEDAAVEARRLVALLERYGAEDDPESRPLHAALSYIAATVFERAGETNDALVAYRIAHAHAPVYPERPTTVHVGTGEVVVVLERGFVAHRVTESIQFVIGESSRPERRRGPGWGRDDDEHDDDGGGHLVHVAVPALRRSPRLWAGPPRLFVADDSILLATMVRATASVDDGTAVDERRERAATVAREIARVTGKYVVTKAVRDRSGEVAGKLAELGAAFLERADVRSWHLLPQELTVLRLQLPAGRHRLRVVVGDGAARIELPLDVDVRAGAVTVVPARIWHERASSDDWSR